MLPEYFQKRLSKSQSAVEVTVLFSTAFLALGNFVLCITSECFWPICHLSPARFVCTLGRYFRRMAQCALIELCRALFSNLTMFCFNTCLSICLIHSDPTTSVTQGLVYWAQSPASATVPWPPAAFWGSEYGHTRVALLCGHCHLGKSSLHLKGVTWKVKQVLFFDTISLWDLSKHFSYIAY